MMIVQQPETKNVGIFIYFGIFFWGLAGSSGSGGTGRGRRAFREVIPLRSWFAGAPRKPTPAWKQRKARK
jgi:hypothetical protein